MKSRGDNVYYVAYIAACAVIGWLMGNSKHERSQPIDSYRSVTYVQPQAPRAERNPVPVCPKGQHVVSVTFTRGFITGGTCGAIND